MSWKRRILELVLAGGTLAGCGDGSQVITNNFPGPDLSVPVCNANADPCCNTPSLPQCKLDGGTHD